MASDMHVAPRIFSGGPRDGHAPTFSDTHILNGNVLSAFGRTWLDVTFFFFFFWLDVTLCRDLIHCPFESRLSPLAVEMLEAVYNKSLV